MDLSVGLRVWLVNLGKLRWGGIVRSLDQCCGQDQRQDQRRLLFLMKDSEQGWDRVCKGTPTAAISGRSTVR